MEDNQKHPIDRFFQERESNIPVHFNSEHWLDLDAQLQSHYVQNRPKGAMVPKLLSTLLAIIVGICIGLWWGARSDTPLANPTLGPSVARTAETPDTAKAISIKEKSGTAHLSKSGSVARSVETPVAAEPLKANATVPDTAPAQTLAPQPDSLKQAPEKPKKKKHLLW